MQIMYIHFMANWKLKAKAFDLPLFFMWIFLTREGSGDQIGESLVLGLVLHAHLTWPQEHKMWE
jgi:hypothetical protein